MAAAATTRSTRAPATIVVSTTASETSIDGGAGVNTLELQAQTNVNLAPPTRPLAIRRAGTISTTWTPARLRVGRRRSRARRAPTPDRRRRRRHDRRRRRRGLRSGGARRRHGRLSGSELSIDGGAGDNTLELDAAAYDDRPRRPAGADQTAGDSPRCRRISKTSTPPR